MDTISTAGRGQATIGLTTDIAAWFPFLSTPATATTPGRHRDIGSTIGPRLITDAGDDDHDVEGDRLLYG